jgi:hypothetical protein
LGKLETLQTPAELMASWLPSMSDEGAGDIGSRLPNSNGNSEATEVIEKTKQKPIKRSLFLVFEMVPILILTIFLQS